MIKARNSKIPLSTARTMNIGPIKLHANECCFRLVWSFMKNKYAIVYIDEKATTTKMIRM